MKYNQRKKQRWLIIIIAFIFMLPFNYFCFDKPVSVEAATTTTGTVTANLLNVRKGAGTSYSILKNGSSLVRLKKGTKVTINSTKGNWYYVSFSYSGKTLKGYVSKTYVKKSTTSVSSTTSTTNTKTATVTTNKLNVRKGAGTSYSRLTYNGKKIQLSKGTKITILSTKSGWYYVSFKYNNKTLKGYVSATYVSYSNSAASASSAFEQKLSKQGFPESYKVLLRKIHEKYPKWEFVAYDTGINFSDAVKNEMVPGRSLIPNSKNISWKSLNANSYNWATDKFIVYDGDEWVNASENVIKYYMDPRNFLYENSIYQFEFLSYKKNYQTQVGVENILNNTPMYKKKVTYTQDSKKQNKYYSAIFMEAAAYSGVSPYHLASRVKHEVVTGKNSFSASVTGNVNGYVGYYNFYNIGAKNSTLVLGAIKNGLSYAKNGSTDKNLNKKYMIPWNTPYKAIVGGSVFIGANYINKGQDTLYLQKFNVTPVGRYYHQYMCNIQAAWSEGLKVFSAYESIGNNKNLPIIFSIPVYRNMPSSVCSLPSNGKNPNNWLKTLSVSGYTLSPAFDVNKVQTYSISVANDVSAITISAKAVSSLADVTGTGKVALKVGKNAVNVKVKSESGSTRTYVINVTRAAN